MNRLASALLMVLLLLTGCRDDGWNPSAPFAPSLRPAFGARITDGHLQIWTGSLCMKAARVALAFEPSRAELVLTSDMSKGVDVEYLTVGGRYEGFETAEALPAGFDWRSQESIRLSVGGSDHGRNGWGSYSHIAEVIKGSDNHPDDTYWFQDVGWLNPAEVAAKDGKDFLATCTPDPAKTKKK